ncbi:hypothetical protein [Methanococcoides alaskense]|uniref:Chaperonin cofactor prefoldin n=1 Tax=Methanococcoides alaskense TaxID=325778 RepID=A0AA90U0I6_9EURY|nr:hypothetical protein [Methanococcoides alaskense]MDA0525774.1 hypothetical protein [Methanococcoides alaskense]MDR6223437.1 chaperonin cofactor prefoldin [Methanococcoides alaskense]
MNTNDVIDLSGVSPQQMFLESYPEKPLATSTLYIKRFTTTNLDKSQNHTVDGVHIVLAQDNPNGLWDVLHVDRNTQKLDPQDPYVATRSLQICCDTIEIHGELSVPEADVTIYARRLVWATADAAINTSPLPWVIPKAGNAVRSDPGKNGVAGRNAGTFQLFVSEVDSADDSWPRLLALGGRGQDPGAGMDGNPGVKMGSYSSIPFKVTDSDISKSSVTVNFKPVAVYVDYEWRWALSQVAHGKCGENSFPTNGGNALAPGIPGDGGNGGSLTTNLAAVVPSFKNTGGQAGTKESDYRGGKPGIPRSCGKYKVKLWENLFGTNNAHKEVTKTNSNKTAKGEDAKAQSAPHGAGSTPEPSVIPETNAWLHPLGLQKTLEYTRDLFLSGNRVEVQDLLCIYEGVLAVPLPNNNAWDDGTMAQWTAAQSEVASMLQRLRGHLDYFGNAAGYTPLLSLQGTIKLYAEETRRALRTLLLAGWIDAKERDAKETAKALGDAIISLNEDSQQAAAQVASSEVEISKVMNRIDALEQELNSMSNQLEILRNNLLSQAQGDLDKQGQIKFAIKMAAALCQVVPVGQPALGTVGSLASVATDFIGGDDAGAPDTVSKMGDMLTKAREAGKKAKEAGKEAGKEKGSAPAKDAQSAKDGVSAWAKVGDGLGPALSQVSQGLQALQVPQSEVEAELQRLESESEEWNKLAKDIRDLNERKAAFFSNLMDAFQSLGDGYARVSSNAAAVFIMQQERSKNHGKLNPVAMGCVRQMGQQSRLTLLRHLYFMVKAYETTVLKSIKVDWKLTEVADKINELLKSEDEFNAASLDLQATVLEPLYQKNLDTVRNQLLDDFSFNETTITLQLGLSSKQTPEVIAALNDSGNVVVDPLAYGLVLPDQQLARLSNVVLKKLEFDPNGPALTETDNVIVSVQPAHSGTIRKAEALYSVYSDETRKWSWTLLASGEIRASEISKGNEDVLDLVLGSGAENIKQKVSLPPVWSDLSINVLYSPELRMNQRPRITKLYFEFSSDVTSAPDDQRVLNVQSLGSTPGAVIKCSPDLANRSDGFYRMIRIFSKGDSVRLNVPSHVAGSAFDAWDIVGRQINRIGVKQTEVDIKIDEHVLAQCHWSRYQDQIQPIVLSQTLVFEDIAEIAENHEDENIRRELMDFLSAAPPVRDFPIRVEASDIASVVGVVPTLNDADLLEEGDEGWKLVNYRGIVGWVNA